MVDYKSALLDCLSNDQVWRAYFPSEADVRSGLEPFLLCTCAVALRAMAEAPLDTLLGSPDWEQYRFVWLRTSHNPVAVRINKKGRSRSLTVKILDGQGGYDLGKLQHADERTVEDNEWCEVARLIAGSQFWALPVKGTREGLDGAAWFLEATRGEVHKLVYRWSPEAVGEDAAFRAACFGLLSLARIGATAEPVY